jgi:hypothetical protein
MRKIDIAITKAQIKGFSVELQDGLPEVTAQICLFAPNGKEVATFGVSTKDYYGSAKFELPPEMICPIQEIAGRLEAIVTAECNKKMAMLEVYPGAAKTDGSAPDSVQQPQ